MRTISRKLSEPDILPIIGIITDEARLHRDLARIYEGTALGAGHLLKARDRQDAADDLEGPSETTCDATS